MNCIIKEKLSKSIRKELEASNNSELRKLSFKLINFLLIKNFKGVFFEKHPLGFIDITAHKFSNGDTLNIHIWEKSLIIPTEENIHNHFFDSISYVLIGGIYNNFYSLDYTKEGSKYYYKSSYNWRIDSRILEKQGLVGVFNKRKILHKENTLYKMTSGQFHSIEKVTAPLTVSIFLRYNVDYENAYSYVLKNDDSTLVSFFKTKYLKINLLSKHLESILSYNT